MRNPGLRHGVVLARRVTGCTQVTLLWTQETNLVFVQVRDGMTGGQFELLVPPAANALDVYEHPYAYAAWGDVDYELGQLSEAA